MAVPEERARGLPIRRLIVGLALIAFGVAWLADVAGYSIPWQTLLPVALMLVGTLLIVGISNEGDGLLFAAGLVLLVVIMSTTSTIVEDSAISSTHRITSIGQLEDTFRETAGNLTLDLSDLSLRTEAELNASVGVGDLVIELPQDFPVLIEAEVRSGSVEVFGEKTRGINLDVTHEDDLFEERRARLVLKLEVDVGRVKVDR